MILIATQMSLSFACLHSLGYLITDIVSNLRSFQINNTNIIVIDIDSNMGVYELYLPCLLGMITDKIDSRSLGAA